MAIGFGHISRLLHRVSGILGAKSKTSHAPTAAAKTASHAHAYRIVRDGRIINERADDGDKWLKLRSELELLRQCAHGDTAAALAFLCQPDGFKDPAPLKELRDVLMDARSPIVEDSIAAMDIDQPDLVGRICHEAIADEARVFRNDLLTCLRGADLVGVDAWIETYQRDTRTPLSPPEPGGDTAFESEPSMSEKENADMNAEPLTPNDDATPDSATGTGDASATGDVEEALSQMEDQLDNLNEMLNSEDEVDVPVAEAAKTETESTDEAEASLENTDSIDDSSEDMTSEIDSERDVAAEAAQVDDDASLQEAEEAAIDDVAAEWDTTAESDVEEAIAEAEAPLAADEIAETGDLAGAELADDVAEDLTADDLASEPRQESLEASAASEPSLEDSYGEEPVVPEPASAAPDAEALSEFDEGPAHTPAPTSPRRRPSRRTRRPADEVEVAIDGLVAFLQDEVHALWDEVRAARDGIVSDCDAATAARAKTADVHREMKIMRDEVAAARRESRQLQIQLQNIRDEALRARHRADGAACEAQSAADRALAAAREAESARRLEDE